MAAFTRANSIGWAPGDPVTSAQMNALDIDHAKAPNFVDGAATYNPAGLIQIGGAGFQFNGPTAFASTSDTEFVSGSTTTLEGALYIDGPGAAYLRTSGRIVVQSTGEIAVQSGGDLVIESGGQLTWESGSLSQADSGATVQFASGSVLNVGGTLNFGGDSGIFGTATLTSTATLTFASGSDVVASSGSTTAFNAGSALNMGGTTTLTNSQTLELSPARSWVRHSLRIALVSYVRDEAPPADNYEGPENPSAWVSNHTTPPESGFSSPFIRTLPTNTDTYGEQHYHWIGLDDLPHGGTFSQVVVTSTGTGTTPTTTAKFRIVRVNSAGAVENMSNLTDRTGTWTDSLQTTVTVNAHTTISSSYRYALVVIHPLLTGGSTGPSLRIFDAESSGTIASMAIG